jgi:signal transduction histidine kinase/CheY-like chemotaxis protein
MTRQPGSRFYKTVVIIWLTLSIGSVVLAIISWLELSSQLSAGRKINAVRDDLTDVLKLCLDAETATRGYAITGNTNFLEPLNLAAPVIASRFDDLVLQAKDDGSALQAINDLRASVELHFDWQRRLVDARQHSFSRAADMMNTGEGKKVMDHVRDQIQAMTGERRRQLFAVRSNIQIQLGRANVTSVAAGAVGFGAGLFAFWLTQVALRQQRRERELLEEKHQAERSSQEKTTFLANMSHEIRTPMNAILGFSELLEGELTDPKHQRYLHSVRSSADSLLRLINDILDMSKIESGVLELHVEPTDVRDICNFIRTLFAEPAAKKKIKLNCHVVETLPHALLLDGIRLRQMLVNLVGNAIKFTDRGSVDVRVLWEKQSGSHIVLIVEVLDTGLGIPKDKIDVIFKPFVQAGIHREQEKQGTGLGLSIVKRLTDMMGGTVTVASVMGQGSAFHLRFPNIPISTRLPASDKMLEKSSADFDRLKPSRILVVDDNETNCQLIAGMFAGSHHELFFAYSGEQAIEKAREIKPDAILLDIRMPGMGGSAALAVIRQINGLELIPIVAVTASSLIDEENPIREKFSGYLRKPFSKLELFNELAEFLPRKTSMTAVELPAAKVGEVPLLPPGELQPTPPELLEQLRALLTTSWPSVRDSVAINESRDFALGLEGLGQRWQCPPLTAYAQKLLNDAENYAVTDLEQHLGEFSVLVEELAKNVRA